MERSSTKQQPAVVSNSGIFLPLNHPLLAWIIAMPEKCSKCGTVVPGDELQGTVCVQCVSAKKSSVGLKGNKLVHRLRVLRAA